LENAQKRGSRGGGSKIGRDQKGAGEKSQQYDRQFKTKKTKRNRKEAQTRKDGGGGVAWTVVIEVCEKKITDKGSKVGRHLLTPIREAQKTRQYSGGEKSNDKNKEIQKKMARTLARSPGKGSWGEVRGHNKREEGILLE